MYCKNCGQQIDDNAYVCIHCGVKTDADESSDRGGEKVAKKIEKKNILGGLALIFAFLMPIVGIILGITSIIVACNGDGYLRKDGIIAIVISVVVIALRILFFWLLLSLGVTLAFSFMTM